MNSPLFLISPFALTCIIEIILAARCFALPHRQPHMLGLCCASAALATFAYALSIIAPNEFYMSVASAVYFCAIDLILFTLLCYCIMLTEHIESFRGRPDIPTIGTLVGLDCLVQLTNPLTGWSLGYTFVENAAAHWRYAPHMVYNLHLVFAYTMVAYVVFLLVRKLISVPDIYRSRYVRTTAGLLFVIAINALYLFVPNYSLVDFSVIFYIVLAAYYCWCERNFARRIVLSRVQNAVLENLDRPIVLFDYNEHFALANGTADKLFGRERLAPDYTLDAFIADFSFPAVQDGEGSRDFRWHAEDGMFYDCDYRRLHGRDGRVIGHLFVLTDASAAFDRLTEFRNRTTMERDFTEGSYDPVCPASVIICDLPQLSELNAAGGKSAGDRAIAALADTLRRTCPEGSYLARLEGSSLLAVCPETDMLAGRALIDTICTEMADIKDFPLTLRVQHALCVATGMHPNLIEAVTNTSDTLRTRRMLDSSLSHASILSSLAQAQNESNPAMEAHVQLTRLLADMLGRRMGLSDTQLNDLSLLCLLHDIGQLGIPLEIVNKPGRLTREEWDIMRSHVEKGFNIATVSRELRGVADAILHHHECWDGSGYPDGLLQEAIPLLSRIIAVIDTFDALTNDRPYRPAISVQSAANELRRCAGTQFDPNIVAEFLHLLPEIYGDDLHAVPAVSVSEESMPGGAVRTRKADFAAESTLHSVAAAMYTLDAEQHIIDCNAEFTLLTGYTRQDVEDYRLREVDLIFPEDRDLWLSMVMQSLQEHETVYLEHRIRRKDGSARYVLCYGRIFVEPATHIMRSELMLTDITTTSALRFIIQEERSHLSDSFARWKGLIRRDSLTGLLSHGAFYADAAELLLDESHRCLLLVMDLDNFKTCNDTLGHQVGDELLNLFAAALQSAVDKDGLCGRVGGDEFAAIVAMPVTATPDELRDRAESIRTHIVRALSDHYGGWTVSMGAASEKSFSGTISALYKNADDALYRAKNAGKNRLETEFTGD